MTNPDSTGADAASNRVILDISGSLATITLNRPDKRNAIDLAMLDGLDRAFDAVEQDRSLRSVILTGSGQAFCAGGDITAWSDMDAEAFAELWIRRGHRSFDRLGALRPPTIAVLNGNALGGGLELAACCDFRIAEEPAKLGLPEASLGMVPGWSGTRRLARRFGLQIVRRLALGGEILNAADACAAGLVDHVVGQGQGIDAARTYAATIAGRGRVASASVKAMLAITEGESADTALDVLSGRMIAATDGLREGVAAFHEKRKPEFKD